MGEKTEQPSAKRLRDARRKGEVAHSKDFTQTLLILAIFGYFLARTGYMVETMAKMILMPAQLMRLSFSQAVQVLIHTLLKEAVELLLPVLGIVLLVGLFAETIQVGVFFAFEKLKPSAKKLNALANLQQIFSLKNFMEFLKSCLKIAFLSTLTFVLIRNDLPVLTSIPEAGLTGLGEVVGALIKSLLIYIGIAYGVIALADLVWQRYQFRKGHMMAKEEVKQEYKEMEGDVHIKHKRKQLHQEMLQNDALQSARQATVIVTNPTHLAVALYYDGEETPLPLVLAKGEGALAEGMMKAAREAGVPVMQNIPLARSLTTNSDVGQYVPSELVEPVAELLRLLQQLDRHHLGLDK